MLLVKEYVVVVILLVWHFLMEWKGIYYKMPGRHYWMVVKCVLVYPVRWD